jgi:hypothetical protein
MKLMQKQKTTNCRDLEHIIKIQEKIIKAQNKTIQYSDQQYWQLHLNALGLKEVYEVQQKELELAYKDRNEAIRRYNALAELGVMAESMGIDLTEKLPEKQRAEWNKKYKFSINTKLLESGKYAYEARLEKQSSNGKDFKKSNGKDKKK